MPNTSYFRKVECICNNCNTKFYLAPSRVGHGRGKHCSKTCFQQTMSATRKGRKLNADKKGEKNPRWKGVSAEKECLICKKLFKKPTKTCGRECGDKYRATKIMGENNPYLKKNPAERKECVFCGNMFYRSHENYGKNCGKSFCSDVCRIRGMRISPRQLWINKKLIENGFVVEMEKSWPWLHRPGIGQRMRVDLWLSNYNLAIEYDGEQHSKVCFGLNETDLQKTKDRDFWKNKLLTEKGITLFRLNGWPINIDDLLNRIRQLPILD